LITAGLQNKPEKAFQATGRQQPAAGTAGFDIISVKCIAYIVNIWYDKHRLLI
jgi:hypothetical protein